MSVYGRIRFKLSDPIPGNAGKIQFLLNDSMRTILGVSRRDKTLVKELLEKTGLPSFNKIVVEATLQEVWKCLDQVLPCYDLFEHIKSVHHTSAANQLRVPKLNCDREEWFVWKGAKLWNHAFPSILSHSTQEKPNSIIKDFAKNFNFFY